MIVVACIPLMCPLFSRSETRRPPNVRYYENNSNAGTHMGKRKKRAAAKLPRLLHPPSWFDSKDVDAQVELQTGKLVQVPVAEPTSITHRSGVPEAAVADRKQWSAPESWHAFEGDRKPGLHEPNFVQTDAL